MQQLIGSMRINKFLSRAGIASRRGADVLIEEGRVFLNGKKIAEPGVQVNPENDSVKVDGKLVKMQDEKIYIALNKPKGYVTTRADMHAEKTVYDLLPKKLRKIVHPVGRLDKDSEGLLFLTNDGNLTYKLTHPKFQHKKEYEVYVSGALPKEKLDLLRRGVKIDGKKTAPAEITFLKKEKGITMLSVIIHEGRKRQIRRMFEKVGNAVKRLVRVKEAGVDLRKRKIKAGEYQLLQYKNLDLKNNL